MTGMIRDVLVRHFSEGSQVESPDLRRYVWTEGDQTGIAIESIHVWREQLSMRRPAVLIKPNAYKLVRIALNDLSGITEDGSTTHTKLCVGSHTVFCLQKSGAAAEILATEVEGILDGFAPVLRRHLGLNRFEVLEVGGVEEIDESSEHFGAAVTVGWAFKKTRALHPESLPIKRFDLSTVLTD